MKSIQALVVACALCGTGALAQEPRADMRGVTVSVGGGVEGYSGGLAPRLDAGPSYGAAVAIKPTSVLGLELAYSGAVNNISVSEQAEELLGNPDVVRNGGRAVATLGLTASPIQPYVLGGIGVDDYNVRNNGETLGYQDDTVGSVPLGAGLRFHNGDLSADLRASYNLLFSEEFAPESAIANQDPEDVNFAGGNSYNATLNVGFTF